MANMMSSAAGFIGLLEEESPELKQAALQKLHQVVDTHWVEVADAVAIIESLAEDDLFPARTLAASVASKCFYHLEEYDDALRLALSAGEFFDLNAKTEYVETMISRCLEEYIRLRKEGAAASASSGAAGGAGGAQPIDPRLESIVERMFERCFRDAEYEQAMGIALESHRLDIVERAISNSGSRVKDLLEYTFDVAQHTLVSSSFRGEVLAVLVKIYNTLDTPDYLSLSRCLQFLDKSDDVAAILLRLVETKRDEDLLMAYQIAFDLCENDNQQFLFRVSRALPSPPTTTSTGGDDKGEKTDKDEDNKNEKTDSADAPATASQDSRSPEFWATMATLRSILDGSKSLALYLDFLFRHNKTDNLLLRNLMAGTEGPPTADNRSAVLHHAAIAAHGFMSCGTTVDVFLRDNIKWLGKATHWSRFSVAASQGVVHKGNLEAALQVLDPYLPKPGQPSGSAYAEGGALYALGLIHAAKGASGDGSIVTYLANALDNTTDHIVMHGACLGIGLASLGTGTPAQFEKLLHYLNASDRAVVGEAVGLSIGMILLGRLKEDISEVATRDLLAYAHDTKHEKIIRGISLGLAMIAYGQEEAADGLIEQMIRDKDALIRYGGMYALALAYVGTANNSAIRRLLHVSVSDVNDAVRRAAVSALGYVLLRSPEQVPRLVSLLAESYNPHVRYGSCMAIGVACAGTAMDEAIRILEPMLDDASDFVRQGALIAMAMVLQQESEARTPKVKTFRDKLASIVADKYLTTLTKMGAVLAQGIIDAGGRNLGIALRSRAGFVKSSAVVGMMMFQQYWYWYSYMHFFSLSLAPTAIIGLTKELKLPADFSVTCNAKPSEFAYPEPLQEKKEEKKERIATVELSTTAKARAKARAKEKEASKEKEGEAMDTQDDEAAGAGAGAGASAAAGESGASAAAGGAGEDAEEKKAEEETKPAPEPTSFQISNPGRVTLNQQPHIELSARGRYVPVRKDATKNLGVILLRDTRPGEAATFVKLITPGEEDPEPEPPEDFIWKMP